MVWWCGIAYLLFTDTFTLPRVGLVAGLAYLAYTIGQIFIFIREGINVIIDRLNRFLL